MRYPVATLSLRDGGRIVCQLRPDCAPNTVRSFIHLARLGVFDGHAVERIAPGFVADMSFTAFGRREARYLLPYETRDAGFDNPLPAAPGSIVMGGYDEGIAGGEFFFPLAENARIRWHYPAFGTVLEGMDVLARWNALPVREQRVPFDPDVVVTVPLDPPVIARVSVETFGERYPEPDHLSGVPLPKNWGRGEA